MCLDMLLGSCNYTEIYQFLWTYKVPYLGTISSLCHQRNLVAGKCQGDSVVLFDEYNQIIRHGLWLRLIGDMCSSNYICQPPELLLILVFLHILTNC